MGITVFNSLPLYLKQLHNNFNGFKLALKDFLYGHSFYTLEEYLIMIMKISLPGNKVVKHSYEKNVILF
jgi:hypothetical protein